MRAIRIDGMLHSIPSEREWVYRTQEPDHRYQVNVITEYRFQPEPCSYVEIREMRQTYGFSDNLIAGEARNFEEEWVTLPHEPLNEYLIAEPDQAHNKWEAEKLSAQDREHYYRYGVRSGRKPATFNPNVNMAEAEKRFLAALVKPEEKKKKKVSKRPKSALEKGFFSKEPIPIPAPEDDLVEKAYNTYSGGKSYNTPFDTYGWGPNPKKEEEMSDVLRFHGGNRVVFQDPQTANLGYGTVVGRVPEMIGKTRPEQYLVAPDRSSKQNSTYIKYTGRHHGLIVDAKKTGMIEAPEGNWHEVPEHIGVFVAQEFCQDHVEFNEHVTGRILKDVSGGRIDISWNFHNYNFHSIRDKAGKERLNVWSVPADKLNMCVFNLRTKEVLSIWPFARLGQCKEREPGDLCTVRGGRVTVLDSEDQEVVLQSGTVVELIINKGGRALLWECKIVGECADNLLNKTVQIRDDYLNRHSSPENFYLPGQEVEIVAVVDFRKKPLQGMKGRVILSTDREGDVGIEFNEDIGAGSLDGIGREGHCIYIEASLVKSSE